MQSSNVDFFNHIYSEFYSVVYQKTKNNLYSKNEDDITSCVQDTYITAIKNIDNLKNHKNIQGWLIVTAKNIAGNFNIKYSIRQKATDMKTDIKSVLDEVDFTQEIVENTEFEEFLRLNIAEQFINNLSESEYQVYELKHIKKMKNEDIAKILNITPNAVASRNKRLIYKFKRKFLNFENRK